MNDIAIKISNSQYKLIKQLANKEGKKIKFVLSKAIENYLRAKKVLPLVCMTKKG